MSTHVGTTTIVTNHGSIPIVAVIGEDALARARAHLSARVTRGAPSLRSGSFVYRARDRARGVSAEASAVFPVARRNLTFERPAFVPRFVMATRTTRVEDVVNMRDLALGVNDWYNVTPSIRRAIEGFASILQEQAAHLERVDAALGLAPPGAVPPTPGAAGAPGAPQWAQTPAAPRPLAPGSSASDIGALAERVEHLTQELATAKAKLRALETARSGDVLGDIAERACDLATSRAETAAREATAAARECRAVEAAVERAEAAAAEATKARDAFSSSLAVKVEGSESRVRSAAAQAEVRIREAGNELKRAEAALRDVDLVTVEKHTRGVAGLHDVVREIRVAVFGGDAGTAAGDGVPGADPRWDPRTPGPGTPGMGTPGMGTPGMGTLGMGTLGMGALGMGAPGRESSSLMSRMAEVSARTDALSTTVDALAAGGGAGVGGAAAQQLTVGLQQLHAAVGASLKERPTTSAVRAMIEERSKEKDLDARVSALEAEADADASAGGAGGGGRRALETINAVSRRVGVLEDSAHAMERRQQRTERVVEDVRRALDVRTRREEVSTIRKIRADERSRSDSDSDSDSESYSTPASERRRAVTAAELMAGAKMTF